MIQLNRYMYLFTEFVMIKFVLQCDLWQVSGFPPGTLVSSTNKTDRHSITEILLKVALNTINQPTNVT
jgi:hypothetical protein